MLDSNGSFDNPFFQDKKIVKIDCKWKGQEYSKDTFGFTHAEYVCSFILKENPEAEIVLVPIVRKNKKSTLNTLNHYYPYQTLKQKQCYFLTNRIEEPLEQRFIREVTRTERCDTFESGMEKLRNIKTAEQYPVLFIDHNNYQEICEYKERIRVYAMEHPETEIVLRYPLFNMVERLDFQKKTNRNLNQFTV